MEVVWHPIKSEADLPPLSVENDYWLTLQDVTDNSRYIEKGWLCGVNGNEWVIDGEFIPWDQVSGADCRVIAWADYTPPAPYEGGA